MKLAGIIIIKHRVKMSIGRRSDRRDKHRKLNMICTRGNFSTKNILRELKVKSIAMHVNRYESHKHFPADDTTHKNVKP